MNFAEYQDAVLAANIRPYMDHNVAVALWGLHSGRISLEEMTAIPTGEIDLNQAAADLGNILRNLTAIATGLGLDLQEVAEKSLKQVTKEANHEF